MHGSFYTMESLQHLSRFAEHNLHLISCLEFWCAPITTNSEACAFMTLIWSSAQERCVSGTRRDVWMQRLSRREVICGSAAFTTRYLEVEVRKRSTFQNYLLIPTRSQAAPSFRLPLFNTREWHLRISHPECINHTYISPRGRLVQHKCLWKCGSDEQHPD